MLGCWIINRDVFFEIVNIVNFLDGVFVNNFNCDVIYDSWWLFIRCIGNGFLGLNSKFLFLVKMLYVFVVDR